MKGLVTPSAALGKSEQPTWRSRETQNWSSVRLERLRSALDQEQKTAMGRDEQLVHVPHLLSVTLP